MADTTTVHEGDEPDTQVVPDVARVVRTGPHLTVHEALARVMGELPGIGKDDTSPEGYKYRGIEAITRHAQAAFARYGVVIYPVADVVNIVQHEDLSMNKGWREFVIQVTWQVCGAGGDKLDPCPVTWGQGRDKSDKSINKAMTQAYKYLLLQLLCVSDQADDPDHVGGPSDDQYQTGAGRPAEARRITKDQATAIAERIKALDDDARAKLAAEWTAEDPTTGDPWLPVRDGKPSVGQLTDRDLSSVERLLGKHEATAAPAAPAAPATPAEPPGERPPGAVHPSPAAQAVANPLLPDATTHDEIVGIVRSMTIEECQTELLARGRMPDAAWAKDSVRLRAELAQIVHVANGVPLPEQPDPDAAHDPDDDPEDEAPWPDQD